MVPGVRLAPITAIDVGLRIRRIEATTAALSLVDVLVELTRRCQREADVDDTAVEMAGDIETGVAEHVHHRSVVGERLGVEPFDAVAPGDSREVFEHDRRQAAALLVVFDDEGDLRSFFVLAAVVTGDGDDLAIELGDERESIAIVDLGEVMKLRLGDLRQRREEPEVDRLRREPAVQGAELLEVIGSDRADVRGSAVDEHDVGLPLARIRRRGVDLGSSGH